MDLPTFESIAVLAALPLLIVVGWGCVLLLADLFIGSEHKHWTAWLAMLGLLGAGAALIWQGTRLMSTSGPVAESAFGGMLRVDGFAVFLQMLFVLSAILGILLALDYLPRHGIYRGEFYVLMLFTTGGMMIMSMADELIVIVIALELLTIPLYILSGLARPNLQSEESAMKYFLLGAFSSSFLLYGVALIYGGTATTSLPGVLTAVRAGTYSQPLVLIGLAMILAGLCFKVAVVPFHMWTPDVYQGAPTPVTAFMSVGAKAGGFAAMIRVLLTAAPDVATEWGPILAMIAILTMTLGNVVAIAQSNIKRMLAYSSIAHAGYVLVAVAAAQRPADAPLAVSAALFYLLTYTFTNLGAFAVVIAVERHDSTGNEIGDFSGLGKTHPWAGIAMAIFMLSLTGMPISAGLVGKFFVFKAAIQASLGNPWMLAAAVVGVVTSVVSAFYYLRVVWVMFMGDGEGRANLPPALAAALATTAVVTLAIGVIPTPLFRLAQEALLVVGG